MEAVDEIVAEFLVESHENLDQLDQDLLALERNPGSRELLASVFRTIHTIKGASGFLAFHRLEKLSHVGENLLSRLRDGTIALTEARSTALLTMVDAIRGLLADIERTGGESDVDHSRLIATLSLLLEDADDEPADRHCAPIGQILVQAGQTTPDDVALARIAQGLGDNRPLGSILVHHGATTPAAVDGALDAQGRGRRSVLDSTVRVDVELLDSLVRLVEQLALARNDLLSRLDDEQDTSLDSSLAACVQQLDLVTGELQEHVLKTRMQPVGVVWAKMPRVVRDLARACGKQVRLEMEGRETEVDRALLEAIRDPLTHLVRNAVDHGIESAEARVAAGKPAEGVLVLRAYHEAGRLQIEVAEDGAGMDHEKIAATALERGLVSPPQLATMGDSDLLSLIFMPGFSTAAQVTNISGRGVGMDIVKTRIEAVGGVVDVTERARRGHDVPADDSADADTPPGAALRSAVALAHGNMPMTRGATPGRRAPIRVLVVDDSLVIRRLVVDSLGGDPDIEVVGQAPNGRIALEKVAALAPDAVTMDIEMPEMNGIEAVRLLRRTHPRLPVVMLCTLTERGAAAALDALAAGADDYVAKPSNVGSFVESQRSVREQLVPKIKALTSPPVVTPEVLEGQP